MSGQPPSAPPNVLHAFGLPDWYPVVNHCSRCCDEPCVNVSWLTRCPVSGSNASYLFYGTAIGAGLGAGITLLGAGYGFGRIGSGLMPPK